MRSLFHLTPPAAAQGLTSAPEIPTGLQHHFTRTERGWRNADIHLLSRDETSQSLLHAATIAHTSLPQHLLPLLPRYNNPCTRGSAQGHCQVLLQRTITVGCSPNLQDASRAGGKQTSMEGRCNSGTGWISAAPGCPRPGCWSRASTGPRPTAWPGRLPVGDPGPSLTHIPSFGWRFLFFPSPGALINIPELDDIRAGADPCYARSSRSTSHPGPHTDPRTPEMLLMARH